MVPSRERAAHVSDEFRRITDAKGLRVAAVSGGPGIAKQITAAGRADILIAVPGRLLDLLRRRLLRLNQVGVCVVDQADRMLDRGLLPNVGVVLSVLPQPRQTMVFSTTFDGEIGALAVRFTKEPVRHQVNEQQSPRHAAARRTPRARPNGGGSPHSEPGCRA
jgi:superfamily II DNA/RNA helicase